MDPIRQRIAIAKACGLTVVSDGITHHLTPCGKKTEHAPEGCLLKECPDYLNDLDAIHEVEKTLVEKVDQVIYAENLSRIIGRVLAFRSPGVTDFDKMHATAEQRAEAFLETRNLWTP